MLTATTAAWRTGTGGLAVFTRTALARASATATVSAAFSVAGTATGTATGTTAGLITGAGGTISGFPISVGR
ncbi:MAG: hypothetical protein KA250_09265 [Verrucomicrobiales bacterium]|nr:hypothetical protein [Verrucomicrobiales bacterium]